MATETNGYISRGNMSIILVAAGLIMGGFGWFTTNQNGVINARIDELREAGKHYIVRGEHEEFKLRIDKDISRIESHVVPRAENETRWIASEKDVRVLQDRINELRTATTSTYTLRDEINRLQKEVADLRGLLGEKK